MLPGLVDSLMAAVVGSGWAFGGTSWHGIEKGGVEEDLS